MRTPLAIAGLLLAMVAPSVRADQIAVRPTQLHKAPFSLFAQWPPGPALLRDGAGRRIQDAAWATDAPALRVWLAPAAPHAALSPFLHPTSGPFAALGIAHPLIPQSSSAWMAHQQKSGRLSALLVEEPPFPPIVTPEPASMLLVGSGIAALLVRKRRSARR